MSNLSLFVLGLSLAVPGARELRLSVAPEVGCEAAQVKEALERRFGPGKVVVGPPLADQPSLHLVRSADGETELELAEGVSQPTSRRNFAATDRCVDVAETVALLTEAWLQQLPWKGEGILPEAAQPSPRPSLSPSSPSGERVIETRGPTEGGSSPPKGERLGEGVPPPEALDAGAATSTAPGPVISTASVTPEVVHPVEPPTPEAPKTPPRVSLQLGFGGSLDGKATFPGYFGSALVDVAVDARRRFGVGVDFELQDTLSVSGLASAPGSSLSIQRQELRLFGRYAFNADKGLRLLAGLGAERFAATPSGFTPNTPVAVLDPELWLSACWLQPLWKRLYAFGQAGVSLQLQQEQFYVNPQTATDVLATLSPVWLTLTAGLGAQLF